VVALLSKYIGNFNSISLLCVDILCEVTPKVLL
jgi:hypothetical protein